MQFAQETIPLLPPQIWSSMLVSMLYCLMGLIVIAISCKVIDWMTPGSLFDELLGSETKTPNMAYAIFSGAFLIAISLIVASAIH